MATFEESLLYPLIVLTVGAYLTGIISPIMNKAAETGTKRREIKLDIVSKMTDLIAQLDAEASFLINRRRKLDKEEKNVFFQNAKKWYIESRSIHSKVFAYFLDRGIAESWDAYYNLLNNFCNASRMYFDQDPAEHGILQLALDDIVRQLSYQESTKLEKLGTTFDETLWLYIQSGIRIRGDHLIRDVLKAHIWVK